MSSDPGYPAKRHPDLHRHPAQFLHARHGTGARDLSLVLCRLGRRDRRARDRVEHRRAASASPDLPETPLARRATRYARPTRAPPAPVAGRRTAGRASARPWPRSRPLHLVDVLRKIRPALDGPRHHGRARGLSRPQARRPDLAPDLYRLPGTDLRDPPSGDRRPGHAGRRDARAGQGMAVSAAAWDPDGHHLARLYRRMGVPGQPGAGLGL